MYGCQCGVVVDSVLVLNGVVVGLFFFFKQKTAYEI